MNEISPEQLLNQIRTLGKSLQVGAPPQATAPGQTGFSDLLKNSLDAVNELQKHSSELKAGFENGTSYQSSFMRRVALPRPTITPACRASRTARSS